MSLIEIPNILYQGHETGTIVTDLVSLSADNEYIPLHSLASGEVLEVKGNRMSLYRMHAIIGGVTTRKIARFCEHILIGRYWTRIIHSTLTRKYYGNQGVVVHVDEELDRIFPLMTIGLKRQYLFEVDRANPDPRQFCLIIDRSFITDEQHFKLFRNINKYYIPQVQSQLDVVYTNDLVRLCFNQQSLLLPKFRTVDEMLNNYQSINALIEQTIKREQNAI